VRGDGGMTAMTLEHYRDFALREIGAHIEEAKQRWPIAAVRVVHRYGRLTPGERIVFVGVASTHRQAAFEAASFLMDYLKTRAPFWKLEERAGDTSWVEAREADDDAVRRWRSD
jgi:molybdopterin synthase catalytic subunit